MDLVTTAVAALVLMSGGLVHRITGMGFALLAVPPLVALFGIVDGITIAALAALVASVCVGIRTRAERNRTLVSALIAAVAIGSAFGLLVAVIVPIAAMAPLVGWLTLLAVLSSIVVRSIRRSRVTTVPRLGPFVAAGVLAGVMNSTSAIGGPPLSVIASWIGLRHAVFVSTVQLPFVAMGVFTIGGRGVLLGLPPVPVWFWVLLLVAVFVGVVGGDRVARWVPERVAWGATLSISAVGALSLILSGG